MIKQLTRVALMGVLFAALTAFTVGFQTIKIQTSAVCGMCKDRIEGTLNAIEGVEEARLDLTTKKVKVKFDDSKQSEASIKAIITKIGYAADDLPADMEAFNGLPGCCKSAAACKASKVKVGDATVAPVDAVGAVAKETAAPAKACAKGATAGKACCASKAKGTASVDATSTAAPDRSSAAADVTGAVAAPAKACCSGDKAKSCAKDKAAGIK
ncbi:MAG: cation transporter [Saprospiraceae bacterium]